MEVARICHIYSIKVGSRTSAVIMFYALEASTEVIDSLDMDNNDPIADKLMETNETIDTSIGWFGTKGLPDQNESK